MKLETLRKVIVVLMITALTLLLSSPNLLAEGALAPLPIDISPGPKPNPACFGADGMSYKDASIEVTGGEGRAFDTNYVYLRIKLTDPSQLRTAPASRFNSQSATLGRSIAKRYNAVAAINGDFFMMDSYSVAIRQGTLYRNRPTGEDVLLIDNKGDFHILNAPQTKEEVDKALADLESQGLTIVNALTFGPLMVDNGECRIPEDENFQYFNAGAQVYAQRITFSQLGPLDYLVIATEGPDNENSRGMTLYEMAKTTEQVGLELSDTGCLLSYNLDGGSSSTIIVNNIKINAPGAKSRYINDIIYFATLVR